MPSHDWGLRGDGLRVGEVNFTFFSKAPVITEDLARMVMERKREGGAHREVPE